MSDSLLNKSSAMAHAIAITLALAIVSGQLPLVPALFGQLQTHRQAPASLSGQLVK